jgi:hypothetical protein
VNATLTFLTYYLASRPDILATLQEELGGIEDISDYSALSHLPYLDSLIKEIMRLHPPVPSGSLRSTPVEGITIAGQYIPGGVTVMIPQYILHRCMLTGWPSLQICEDTNDLLKWNPAMCARLNSSLNDGPADLSWSKTQEPGSHSPLVNHHPSTLPDPHHLLNFPREKDEK